MKKVVLISFILFIIFVSVFFDNGVNLQNYEDDNQDNPLDLSNSGSWSRILKEGYWIYPVYSEIVNGSLYVIGYLHPIGSIDRSLYVMKYNSTGTKEWEVLIKIGTSSYPMSCVFDNKGNIFVLYQAGYSAELSIIKLNSSGSLLLSEDLNIELNHFSLVLGENNSLFIFGYYYPHFQIIILNDVGQLIWNNSHSVDAYYSYPLIAKDSEFNLYLSYRNNSLYYLAKINSTGAIEWQKK